ncbi:MAG: class I SAM-dependent methyltransferase [Methylococcales bacterium]
MDDKVSWDYTQFAHNYDNRPDYSAQAIDRVFTDICLTRGQLAADIGAGTGKLTQHLLRWELMVTAVEPNQAMRQIGECNTQRQTVSWVNTCGEATGLKENSFDVVCYGSSFNVMDHKAALAEAVRILKPGGWLICLWNHRDLSEPLQAEIEAIIQAEIPNYQYGTRRQDQTSVIRNNRGFDKVYYAEHYVLLQLRVEDQLAAWRSHATLKRQAGQRFGAVIEQIQQRLNGLESITVPYHTRIWYARNSS